MRRFEYQRDANDPYARLDKVAPLLDLADGDRAKLHAALWHAEDEIVAGKSVPAEDFVRELRAAR